MSELYNSERKTKRFKILTPDNKWIHFGLKGGSTFIDHKDKKKKEAYIARHSKIKLKDGSLAVNKILSSAWLSLNILWNKPTLKQSLRDIKKRFNIVINNNT